VNVKRRRPILLCAAACVVFVAGCGGGPNAERSPAAAALAQSDRAMLQFARCMRAHGIDMRDPFHRAGHSGLSIELPDGAPQTTAYTTCVHYIAQIIATKEAGARAATTTVRVSLVRYAQCMRTHGIPMLDPTPDGSLALGNVPGMSSGLGRDTPQFRSADASCRHFLPPTVHDNGTGP
jgi:hypothetical protein